MTHPPYLLETIGIANTGPCLLGIVLEPTCTMWCTTNKMHTRPLTRLQPISVAEDET